LAWAKSFKSKIAMIFSVRKAKDYDLDLTFKIKKNALSEYLELLWGWHEEAQYEFHHEYFNPDNFQIIEVSRSPIGYLETHQSEDLLFLSNLMILKEFQGKGIGRSILEDLLKNNANIELEVLKVNFLAKRFYHDSGFVVIEEKEDVFRMKSETVSRRFDVSTALSIV
jgi:ribosomal protein S18 acetylase RimI-like enzyme